MTLSEYSYLKQQAKISVGSSEHHAELLAKLKEQFKKEINSPRRFEKITTISQLLEVLELREALSEDDVGPLRTISLMPQVSNGGELVRRIAQYEERHVPRDYRNYYAQKNTQAPTMRQMPPVTSTISYMQISPTKQKRILETVVYEIGKTWKDLARSLKISERNINDIDHNYTRLASKASIMLDFYLKHKADDKWFFELCKALEKSRRSDLSKEITRILTTNI